MGCSPSSASGRDFVVDRRFEDPRAAAVAGDRRDGAAGTTGLDGLGAERHRLPAAGTRLEEDPQTVADLTALPGRQRRPLGDALAEQFRPREVGLERGSGLPGTDPPAVDADREGVAQLFRRHLAVLEPEPFEPRTQVVGGGDGFDLPVPRSFERGGQTSVVAATRLDGVARTIDEIAVVSRVDSLEIKRTYRYVVRELDVQVPPTDPIEYVGRIVSELDCSGDTTRQARQLIEAATAQGVHSGKSPVGIAASAVYAAGKLCGENITQDDVSEVADVSNVTIRNRYREVLKAYEERQNE